MFHCPIAAHAELRLLEERHAEEIFEVVDRNRGRLREWLPWVDPTRSSEDVRAFIRASLEQFARNEGFAAGIWVEGAPSGCIGIHRIDWANRAVSIGYWLAGEHQGKGIVTAACRAVLRHLFGELNLDRVEIRCGTGNARSCAIPERLGFTREGVIRHGQLVNGRPIDLAVYGLLREEWKATAASPGTRSPAGSTPAAPAS